MRHLVVLAVLLAAGPASAQKFEYGKYDEVKDVKDVEWSAAAEAGVVFTTGNSQTTTATGGIKASRKTGANKLSIEGSATYAKAGVLALNDLNGNMLVDGDDEITTVDTVTANTLAGKFRYDRYLTDLNSLFVAALGSRDVPAGKQVVFGGQIGYSRSFYKSDTANTVGEFGYDFSREDLVAPGPAVSIHSLRAFVGHKATMTPGAEVDAAAELLTNLNTVNMPTNADGGPGKDTRINVKLAINAKLGQNLAFSTSIEAKYDHLPGPLGIKNLAPGFVPEASRLDTIMKGSLIYTFAAAKK